MCLGEDGLRKTVSRPLETSLLSYLLSHFTDETEVQRGIVTSPGSPSKS